MTKSKSEIQEDKITKEEKEQFIGKYTQLYKDKELKRLYKNEVDNYETYINKKVSETLNTLKTKIRINENTVRSEIIKKLETEDYEEMFPESTKYIKQNIFHGYDGVYYVLTKNSDGHILPFEYTQTNFINTFGKYFPDHIKAWFNKYSDKHTLVCDNTKPRTFTKDNSDFLNLFSGYKYDKNSQKDMKRIKKGKEGVKFIWNHIYEVWNSKNDLNFEYDRSWIRKLIRGHKLKTMIYLKGKMGVGKSSIVRFLSLVLGLHNTITLSNENVFMGEFNGSLCGIVLCFLDEIVHNFNDFKSLYNKLKPYITDETMSYRNLYEKLKTMLNLTSFIMGGNYDMLKLDDPTKGEDRRIKVNDVSKVLKSVEYFKQLYKYIEDEDVQYAFFWDCIDNGDDNFNELAELKKLPITETKKEMIVASLDSPILFLKHIINKKDMMNEYIKPKILYEYYKEYMRQENGNNRQVMNNDNFFKRMTIYEGDFLSYVKNKKLNGKSPTNYFYFDREKMITSFKNKHYFGRYDEIKDFKTDSVMNLDEEEDKTDYQKLKEENERQKNEIEELKKRLEEYERKSNNTFEEFKEKKIEEEKKIKEEIEEVIESIDKDDIEYDLEYEQECKDFDEKYNNKFDEFKNEKSKEEPKKSKTKVTSKTESKKKHRNRFDNEKQQSNKKKLEKMEPLILIDSDLDDLVNTL